MRRGGVGGGAATANQYIGFNVPTEVSVKARVELLSTSATINYGFGSFSGLEWQWNLDGGTWHRDDISYAFTWDIILGKIISLVGLLGGDTNTVTQAIEYMDMVVNVGDLVSTLAGLHSDYKALSVFESNFTASEGYHHYGFGVRANAAGALTGSAFSMLFGQVQKVTLTISDGLGGTPDLVVSDLRVVEGTLKRGETCTLEVSLCNMGDGSAFNDECTVTVMEPGGADYVTYNGGTGRVGGPSYVQAHETKPLQISYKFDKKGYYAFFVKADEQSHVDESDETNNWIDKNFYVTGLPPNKPTKPTFPDAPANRAFYLNNTYTFSTSTTDPDGDEMRYDFWIRNSLGTVNRSVSGWVATPSVSFGPIEQYSGAIYYVKVRAIDSDGLASPWSDEESFTIKTNQQPQSLAISGPATGNTVGTLSYTASCVDREHDHVYLRFDWGDGSPVTDWFNAGTSAASLSLPHNYVSAGNYSVQVEAQDQVSTNGPAKVSYSVTITTYVPPADSIVVTTSIGGMSFTVNGPGGPINGTTDANGYWSTGAGVGTYTIDFGSKSGYTTPSYPAQVLSAFGSIRFNGNYVHQLGTIYVDTNVSHNSQVVGSGAASGDWHSVWGDVVDVLQCVGGRLDDLVSAGDWLLSAEHAR